MAGDRPYPPMLARDVKTLPPDTGWAFEIKWDGVRAIAAVSETGLRLYARSGNEITDRYPDLAALADALNGRQAVLDCEIIALDQAGKPDFQLLQRRMGLSKPRTIAQRVREVPVRLAAFDLLDLDGVPIVGLPYEQRRSALLDLGLDDPRWQTPAHFVDDGEALLEAARRQDLEGVVAKRLGSPYRPGERSGDWLKLRIRMRQDFVIGGWLPGLGGHSKHLGSVMLGVWNRSSTDAAGEPQRLIYAGAVGSGLSEASIADLRRLLGPLERSNSPYSSGVGPKRDDPVWCEPELVCAVEFSEWTREGTLRQPTFKGLLDEVDPAAVVREGG